MVSVLKSGDKLSRAQYPNHIKLVSFYITIKYNVVHVYNFLLLVFSDDGDGSVNKKATDP